MARNPGMLLMIPSKDKFAIAYSKEQEREFSDMRKVYVHVYEDGTFETPTPHPKRPGENLKTLIDIDRVQLIGYTD